MTTRTFDTDAEQKAYDQGREDEKAAIEAEKEAAGNEKLTIPRIQRMSQEEIAARLDEVNEVMANAQS